MVLVVLLVLVLVLVPVFAFTAAPGYEVVQPALEADR